MELYGVLGMRSFSAHRGVPGLGIYDDTGWIKSSAYRLCSKGGSTT